MQLSAPIYQLKRRAKLLARDEKIPLHQAQDRIACEEGFAAWSLLASRAAIHNPAHEILSALTDGDMFLLGARPGHGKTLLGLEILLSAIGKNKRAVFFTLEYTEQETIERIRSIDIRALGSSPEIVASDAISADFIIQYLAYAPRGTVAIIDYLQILDQQRSKPPLAEQLDSLRAFSQRTGVILGFTSQIDRSFDPKLATSPGFTDIRLPNPIPAGIFSKTWFFHEGRLRLDRVG